MPYSQKVRTENPQYITHKAADRKARSKALKRPPFAELFKIMLRKMERRSAIAQEKRA